MARRAAAALLLALATTGAIADEALGTLFLTPQEREKLDALRRGDKPAAVASGEAATRGAVDHALTGYVQRSDGRTTVWIDGRAVRVPARKAPALEPRIVQDSAGQAPGVRIERDTPR